jgi:hypothetical protein
MAKDLNLRKNHIKLLVIDLGWEYDRMTSSGQETYDNICKELGLQTQDEVMTSVYTMQQNRYNNETVSKQSGQKS